MNSQYKIEKKLIEKARHLITTEELECELEEEKAIKIMIIALCLKYSFKYQFIGDRVFIYSIIDEWYFCFMKKHISLFHKNKLYTTKQYHHQKKFTNIFQTIQYIKKHDDFYYKPNNNHRFDITKRLNSK